MLGYFLRRIQRFILPLKVLFLVGSLAGLVYLVWKVPPDLGNVLIFSLLLFLLAALILSFFFSVNVSLLSALALAFLVFLKAVSLLSPLNLGLFFVFLVLIGLYLHKK